MSNGDKFDKFTVQAKRVMSYAQEEAQRFQHNYIGTEHLLLGLIREGEGVAAKVLHSLGVELDKVRSGVEFIISRGDRIVLGEIGLTPRAKKVIQLAIDEARNMHYNYIGTEHLLLALVREGEGIAFGILTGLGVNLEKVRTQILLVLSQRSTESPIPSEAPAIVVEEVSASFLNEEEKQQVSDIEDLGEFIELDRFDRFTVQAKKVLGLAQEEARHFQHNYIGTEHLLLGLVHEDKWVATEVLRNLGIELSKVRSAMEFFLARGERIAPGEVGLTPRAKKVIELAVDEARRFNHHYIGTEHLLLGLVREGEGIAAGILESLGATLGKARIQTLLVLSQRSRATESPTAQTLPSTPQEAPALAVEEEKKQVEDLGKLAQFTERARKVMSFAQEEALRLQHNYIGTEHLLLGLTREGEGVAARVLKNDFGIELNKARSAVESLIGRGEHTVQGEIELTPRAKKVIELAVEEACELKHHYIGTEHLLLGLVREGEGIAAGILASLAVNPEKVRTQTLLVLTPTSVATTVPEKDPVRPCRVCGSPAPYDFNYCFHCGSELKPKGQGSHIFNYCFHCGAKMKSEEQEES